MKQKIYAFSGSVALHFSLLLLVAVNFHGWAHPPFILGEQKSATIHSYLYPAKLSQTYSPAVPQSKNRFPALKTADPSAAKSAKPQEKTAPTQGQSADALLVLLHNAIQAAQVYPESAQAMQRQGKVTVAFSLAPDGSIRTLQLVKSSGTRSLDDAALDAVRHASPFQHVDRYLTGSKDFQIDVVFELPT